MSCGLHECVEKPYKENLRSLITASLSAVLSDCTFST
ncbi:MAG: hypothetical protein QOH31_5419, partial [Verrucomicrobiota bacterium]